MLHNTDSFIIYIITEDFYEDIAGDVERWFDTSNSDENDERSLPISKNKKKLVFSKMNEEERLSNNLPDLEQKHGHN